MINLEITWIHDPVEDIIGAGTLDFKCLIYCVEKTADSCGFYCKPNQS